MPWHNVGTWLAIVLIASAGAFDSRLAQAGTTLSEASAIRSTQAGFYCFRRADGVETAPGTEAGVLDLFDRPYEFVHLGDQIPAAPGLGFGIVVTFQDGYAGSEMLVTAHYTGVGEGPEHWTARLREDGRIWMGKTGGENFVFPVGSWLVSVHDGVKVIFEHSFEVVSAAEVPDLAKLCVPPVVS